MRGQEGPIPLPHKHFRADQYRCRTVNLVRGDALGRETNCPNGFRLSCDPVRHFHASLVERKSLSRYSFRVPIGRVSDLPLLSKAAGKDRHRSGISVLASWFLRNILRPSNFRLCKRWRKVSAVPTLRNTLRGNAIRSSSCFLDADGFCGLPCPEQIGKCHTIIRSCRGDVASHFSAKGVVGVDDS